MSPPIMTLLRCCQRSGIYFTTRHLWTSSLVPPAPLRKRLLLYLSQHFYDVENFLNWKAQKKQLKLERKNLYYGYTENLHGPNIASAFFVLCMRGGFRYVGQSDWFLTDSRGKFNWDFLKYTEAQLQDVNMSHTLINYTGLDNLKNQQSLRTLSVQGCPEVDDWFLARLHKFSNCLEELDLSHCPRITVGGLTALRNLKGLKRLDVSSLPKLTSPEMVVILLEEMLPGCQIIANGYDFLSKQEGGAETKMHTQAQA